MFIQFKNKSGSYTYTHQLTDISLYSDTTHYLTEPHYYVSLNSVMTEQGSSEIAISKRTYDMIVFLINQRLSIVTI